MSKCIRIAFDALTDLSAAGHDREEAADFEAAWKGALGGLAAALGLDDVRAVQHRSEETETGAEEVLWQATHDLCYREEDGADGDRWQWREPSAERVSRLRGALRLPVAEAA